MGLDQERRPGVGSSDAAAWPVRMGRQAIYNRRGVLVAHELMFRGLAATSAGPMAGPPAARTGLERGTSIEDRATSEMIATTFGDFTVSRLSGGLPLYLNLTRPFLVGELPLPFESPGIVLELLDDVHVDDEVLAGITRLRSRGFQLALGDFVGEPSRQGLLDQVDVVQVDLLGLQDDLGDVLADVRRQAPRARLLAENVEDEDTLDECARAGVELFQGYLFQRPVLLETTGMSPSQVVCLQLLRTLSDPSAHMSVVADLVASDPGLSLRVLRSANSASATPRRRITSLRQAVVLLGPPALRAWVTLTLLGGVRRGSRVHLVTVLARAGCCASVARLIGGDNDAAATAYLAGLVSGIASVTRADVGQVAEDAALDDVLLDALTLGTGPLGDLVGEVLAHEAGLPQLTGHLDISEADLARAYLGSWKRAVTHVSAVLDR